MKLSRCIFLLCLLIFSSFAVFAQTPNPTAIPANSKVYVAPMGGFEDYLIAALRKKSVPLLVVASRELADFEISGSSESKGAGWAKMLVFGDARSSEKASVKVVNLKTGVVAFADSSNRGSAWRGTRSTAEKLAKYLGKKIKEDGLTAPLTAPTAMPAQVVSAAPAQTQLQTESITLASAPVPAQPVDLNGIWEYSGAYVQVTHTGQDVQVNLASPSTCNGVAMSTIFKGQIQGDTLSGTFYLCTNQKLFADCGFSATSDVPLIGRVNKDRISASINIPGMNLVPSLGTTAKCTIIRDKRQDTQYPIEMTRAQEVKATKP